MLAMFGFVMAIVGDFGPLAWIIGALCLLSYPSLIIYGLAACLAINAPYWVYLIGFLCLVGDMD